MASYRPLGTFPQFLLADGSVNNGGLIHFYLTDLTTPQNTWSDPAMTSLNANPVVLDAAGRPTTDIWGSAAYGVVITDSLGANPRTLNNVQPDAGTSTQIPALVNGEFLGNDGSNLIWQAISQLPDPTGFSGDVLHTDGTLNYWAALPAISGAAGSMTVGGVLVQWGTGSAPASGITYTSATITFTTAFSAAPVVMVQPTTSSALNNGWIAASGALSIGTTSFAATFDSNSGFPSLGNFTAAQSFNWLAIGLA